MVAGSIAGVGTHTGAGFHNHALIRNYHAVMHLVFEQVSAGNKGVGSKYISTAMHLLSIWAVQKHAGHNLTARYFCMLSMCTGNCISPYKAYHGKRQGAAGA